MTRETTAPTAATRCPAAAARCAAMPDFVITVPDDPTAARDALARRLAEIAGEQVALTRLLDELAVPTHRHGDALTFHQRVAVLTGLYAAGR